MSPKVKNIEEVEVSEAVEMDAATQERLDELGIEINRLSTESRINVLERGRMLREAKKLYPGEFHRLGQYVLSVQLHYGKPLHADISCVQAKGRCRHIPYQDTRCAE